MTREERIQTITDRIRDEYKKYHMRDPDEWAKIAAHKIYASMIDIEEKNKEAIKVYTAKELLKI